MATTLDNTGIIFPDATTQTTAINDLSDLSVTATSTELNYVDGVTSAIQTQLNSKISGNQTITISGDASGTGTTSISLSLASNSVASDEIASNAVGAAELNVSGNGTSGQVLTSDGDGTFSWTNKTQETYSTASELLTAIKTVDGSGSGLDADTLDGVSSGSFLRSDANDTFTGNIETTSTNGIRFGHANQTDSNDGYIAANRFSSGLNIVGTQTTSGTGRQVRIWGEVITDASQKFWNAGNDGAGSGLDADLLDGQQGSYYLDYSNFTNTPSAGISDIVSDTTPQLGGNLDINSKTITGSVIPTTNDAYDLGSSSKVWRNIYTGDLHLSNEAKNEGNTVDGTKGSWTVQEGESDLYIINNKTGKKFKFNLEEI